MQYDAILQNQINQLGHVPVLTTEQIEHGQKVLHALLERQEQQAVISFSEFMQFALYQPGLGYYAAGSQKIGQSGDFITAPEISPLFSWAIACQCSQILRDVNGDILEVGAGQGTMAADVMLALEEMQSLPNKYLILEVSSDLQQRQRKTIENKAPHLLRYVEWLESWPSEPFDGVILGNELIDAMPVEMIHTNEQGQLERLGVAWDKAKCQWYWKSIEDAQASAELHQWYQSFVQRHGELPKHYLTEVNLNALGWINQASEVLSKGLVLLIDYGFPESEYYHPDRNKGTLMCHYRHHAHPDPLVLVGLQDITAHVDFTALAYAAHHAGMQVAGFCTQSAFLMSTGAVQRAEQIMASGIEVQLKTSQQLKKLMLPSEMGELFKAIGLTKNINQPLMGFAQNDMRARL